MWVRLSQITCATSAQQFASLVMPIDNRCICSIFRRGLYIPWALSILVIDIVGHYSSKTEPCFKHSMGGSRYVSRPVIRNEHLRNEYSIFWSFSWRLSGLVTRLAVGGRFAPVSFCTLVHRCSSCRQYQHQYPYTSISAPTYSRQRSTPLYSSSQKAVHTALAHPRQRSTPL